MAEAIPRPDGGHQPSVNHPREQPQRGYFRGVAAVPQRVVPNGNDSGVVPAGDDTGDLAPAGVSRISRWRSGQVGAPAPPGGRWRTLRRGAGWTTAGLWFALVCWGVWAVSGRESLVSSGLAIGVVLGTATLVFTVSRLLGRVVLEGSMGRQRFSAWPSHLAAFVLLVVGGVAFLQQTWWLVDAWNWVTTNLV